MKRIQWIKNKISMFFLLTVSTLSCAGTPIWTFMPLTATTLSVPSNDTATVQYTITNQSSRVHTLSMQSIPGVTQITTGLGICGNPFILTAKASCTLSLQVNGSQLISPINDGPIVCEQGSSLQCYRPASSDILHITQASSITDVTIDTVSPSSGPASGGTGVTLTGSGFTGATSLTFGGAAATSVNVVSSTSLTAVTPAHATGSVDVVITTPSGSAMKTNGFTYATTAVGQSAYGGTIACLNGDFNNLIAATADNSTGIIWGEDGVTGAISIMNGALNTQYIVSFLGDSSTYAAGLCSNYEVDSQGNTPCETGNACYNDWFLPAGHNTDASGQLNCLYTNRGIIGGFTEAYYWSSTDFNIIYAWYQDFTNGNQLAEGKSNTYHVRCVRAFTP